MALNSYLIITKERKPHRSPLCFFRSHFVVCPPPKNALKSATGKAPVFLKILINIICLPKNEKQATTRNSNRAGADCLRYLLR